MISSRRATTITGAVAVAAAVLLTAPLLFTPDRPSVTTTLAPEGTRYVSGWLPYWKVDAGLVSFTANAALFTDLTTFFHEVAGPQAALKSRSDGRTVQRVVTAAHDRGVPVLAAVSDATEPGTLRSLLADPAARAAHIAGLLPLVESDGYDGIDIDYENFAFRDGKSTWRSTRAVWVSFIAELSAALHQRGKLLTVAVPPQLDDDHGYWVYDWPAIGPYVDALRAMTYDYSGSDPGPLAPLPWVEDTTRFGVAAVGAPKFRVGIPTYGRDAVLQSSGDGCDAVDAATSGTAVALLALAAEQGAAVTFDEGLGESSFRYQQQVGACTAQRQVNVSDARSVEAKAKLAVRERTGIALWSLGGEDPGSWEAIRKAAGDG